MLIGHSRNWEAFYRQCSRPVRLASVCQVPRVYICVLHKAASVSITTPSYHQIII
jgi:hypothetical protein